MTQNGELRELVEAVVAEALDTHVRALHDDIVGRVVDRLAATVRCDDESSTSLKSAIAAIETGTQQTEILTAMVDGAAVFAARTALFVLRGTTAVGWQARGFKDNEAIKVLSIDASTGLASTALEHRSTVTGSAATFDGRLNSGLGVSPSASCAVMPLIVRDRVAALLFAEGAAAGQQQIDLPAIEILVRAAGLWIELTALRKAAGVTVSPVRPPTQAAAGVPAGNGAAACGRTTASHLDTTTSENTPQIAPRTTAPEVSVASRVDSVRTITEQAPNSNSMGTPSSSDPGHAMPPVAVSNLENDEIHKKARRFAKLLVDEIVLYNRDKVAEGRSNRDLYDRLKEDIDKSRATFDRRYAGTPVAPRDYFTEALISGLAQQNADLLGPNFERS
ncbi:MAG TPA: hypothetical protein VD837_08885 [Terriglobales bacterium]|nr:hypothetical protein [Terriglobales bacterium]